MPAPLSQIDLDYLESIATQSGPYTIQNAQDYYAYLSSKGFKYGDLALGVVNDDTPSGILANQHAEEVASDKGITMTVGSVAWLDMQRELLIADIGARIQAGGAELSYDKYVEIHDIAAKASSNNVLDATIFTPAIPLTVLSNNGENVLAQALWDDMVDNTSILDLLGQAIWLDQAAGGAGLWAWQRDLIHAAFESTPGWLETNHPNLYDYLDALANQLGNLPADYGWAFKNPGELIPDSLNGILPDWVTPAMGRWNNPGPNSPLILDLDGDGIEVTKLGWGQNASTVYFDLDNDGFAQRTAWIGADDGFLVVDANANGIIDNQSELFGDSSLYADGFAKLATYDSNTDGKISAADTNWGDLKVWIDANSDGQTDTGELHTLASLNITEISLSVTNPVNTFYNENLVTAQSTFTINGQTREVADVWFVEDEINTKYLDNFVLNEAVLFMPTLKGYGQLVDLHVAMSLDSDLLDMVSDFVLSWSLDKFDDQPALDAEIQAILHKWAGVENVDPSPVGATVDVRNVAFLEKMFVTPWSELNIDSDPYPNDSWQAGQFADMYNNVFENLKAQLLVQTGFADLYDEKPIYNFMAGEIQFGVLSEATIDEFEDRASLASDIEQYWIDLVATLVKVKNVLAFTTDEITWLSDAIQSSGSSLPWSNILNYAQNSLVNTWVATSFSDYLAGGDGSDYIYGGDGDDYITGLGGHDGGLYGQNGDDIIIGGLGNDGLYGGDGNDILDGGDGQNTLYGGTGDDIYVFGKVTGINNINNEGGTDIIKLGEGITISDLRFVRENDSYSHLTIYVAETNKITIDYQLYDLENSTNYYSEVSYIQFSDNSTLSLLSNFSFVGTNSNDNVYGTALNDTLEGLEGNDSLRGKLGSDVYLFNTGFGQDSILEEGNDTDVIKFGAGITLSDLTFVRQSESSNDLLIYVNGSDRITINYQFYDLQNSTNYFGEIETIQFSNLDTINLFDGLTYTTTSANGGVYGANTNDILVGLEGNNYLAGLAGDDTYLFDVGFGQDQISLEGGGYDVIQFGLGIVLDDLRFYRTDSSSSLQIFVGSGSDKITLNYQLYDAINGTNYYDEIDLIRFSDSSTFNLLGDLTYKGTASDEQLHGTNSGNDTLIGLGGVDYLYGYDGNDILNGGAGSDLLYGGSGEDIFVFDMNALGSVDTIGDFSLLEDDKIDLAGLLEAYDPLTDIITDFIEITTSGSHSILKVDIDGGANSFVQIATLLGVTGLTDEAALESSGNIIV